MKLEQVIKGSVLSEKSYALSASNVYMLNVDLKANKPLIRQALKSLFGVDAVTVSTSILRGEAVRRSRSKTGGGSVAVKFPNQKRAFVRLKDGQKLNVISAQIAENEKA